MLEVGHRVLLLGFALMAGGCPSGDQRSDDDDTLGDDDTTAGDDDTGDDDAVPVAPCAFGDLSAAAVHVAEVYGTDPYGQWTWAGAVDAWVWDRPWDKVHGIGVFHHVEVEEGACRALSLDPGGCDGPCGPGEMCAADGTCQEVWAQGASAGTLTVTGVGDTLELEPSGSAYITGLYHTYTAPSDLFAAGDTVTASFSGDVFPASTVSARGVAPMDTGLAGTFLPLVDGQDLVLSWTPGPDPDACVELIVNGHNAAHGLPLGDIIWCVGPDDGTLTVPQAVVEAFPYGTWLGGFDGACCEGLDCPVSEFSRFTRNAVEAAPGQVELIVRSTAYLGWTHEG